MVAPAPAKRLPLDDLESLGVDVARVELVQEFLGEVRADHAAPFAPTMNHGAHGKIGAPAADHVLSLPERGLDAIQRARPPHDYRHDASSYTCAGAMFAGRIPAASDSS